MECDSFHFTKVPLSLEDVDTRGHAVYKMAFAPSVIIQTVSQKPIRRVCPKIERNGIWFGCARVAKHVKEVDRYLSTIAKISKPEYLDALLYIFTASEMEPVLPSARGKLHPFLIPLAYDPRRQRTVGLLRWPTPPEHLPMPLVSSGMADPCLTMLSPSVKAYVIRALAEADYAGHEAKRDAIRAASSLALAYQDGDVDNSGLGVERYLIVSTGGFPDIYEGLIKFHIAKQDESSALITCEAAARAQPGWAEPHAFHAKILQELGRELEARDAARFSLTMPLWTMGSVAEVREMGAVAGYQDAQSLGKIYRRLYEDERVQEIADGKPREQVALDRAAWLLDVCVADQDWGGWEEIREPLASLFDEASMNDMAIFVRY